MPKPAGRPPSRPAATGPLSSHGGVSSPAHRARRGRPRLTPEQLRERLADYCARHGVALNDQGLPPFPAGRRETAQHREWMSLYKAFRRLSARGPDAADLERRQELLSAQQGRCEVCLKPLDLEEARLDGPPANAAVLHTRCLELVALARSFGSEALERARGRI